jgi:hypothetical protein
MRILVRIGLVVTDRKASEVYSVLIQPLDETAYFFFTVAFHLYDSDKPGSFDEFEIN